MTSETSSPPPSCTSHMQGSSQIITKIFIQVVHIMDHFYIIIVNFYILHMTIHKTECKCRTILSTEKCTWAFFFILYCIDSVPSEADSRDCDCVQCRKINTSIGKPRYTFWFFNQPSIFG